MTAPLRPIAYAEPHIVCEKAPDGSRRDYPGVRMAELSGYDIRVNVTGAGLQRAFRIRGLRDVRRVVSSERRVWVIDLLVFFPLSSLL